MIASAHPEANRLAYRIRTAITGESTGLETAKLAWQQAEAVARANAALKQAAEMLDNGTLLDCLLLENSHPRLLETAASLNHSLVDVWKTRCETFGWRVPDALELDTVSKIQSTIEEQGDLKEWLYKQYRTAARSKKQTVQAFRIIELISSRYPEDESAKEEADAKRQQLLDQAAREVEDTLEQLIPAEPPTEVTRRYLALGLPLADATDTPLKDTLSELNSARVASLAEQVRSVVDLSKSLSENANWQEVEKSYLSCDYALAIHEARGDLEPGLRDSFEKVATQLSQIRSKYESNISIRIAIIDIREGRSNKGKPVPIANRIAKLKSLESQAIKTGAQIPGDLQEEIKATYTYAKRKKLPLYGAIAAIIVILLFSSLFFVQQSREQDAIATLQSEALSALQATEQSGSTSQVRVALDTWKDAIAITEPNSSLANQANLLEDWLVIQSSLESEYTKAVADLEKIASAADSLENAPAIEVLSNDIRKVRSDLASNLGKESDRKFEQLLANYKTKLDAELDKNRRELKRIERELRIAANNATQAKTREEFERLKSATETRATTLTGLLPNDYAADLRGNLEPYLESVKQQLNAIETKWAALDNAWIGLAATKELDPYLEQLERIYSFDILPADKKSALSHTLRLKPAFADLKNNQQLFQSPEVKAAFPGGQSYLNSGVEVSEEERAYLTRLQNRDTFQDVYQSTVQYFEGSADPQSEYEIYLVEPISKSDSQQDDSHVAFTFSVRGFDEFGNPESQAREIQFISRDDGSFWGFFYKPSTLSPESEYYQGTISNTINLLLAGTSRLAVLKQLEDLEQQEQLSPAFRIYWQQQFITFTKLHPWKWGLALSPSLKKHAAQLDKLPNSEENERLWLSIIEQTVPSPDISVLAKQKLGELPRKEITTLSKLYQNAASGRYLLAGYVLTDGSVDLLEDTDPNTSLWSVNALTGSIDPIQPQQKLTPYAPILMYALPGSDTPQKQVEKAEFASGLKLREPPYAQLLPSLYQ